MERPVANLERLTRATKPSGPPSGASKTTKQQQPPSKAAGGFAKARYNGVGGREEKFGEDGNGGITEPLLAATLQEEEGEDYGGQDGRGDEEGGE